MIYGYSERGIFNSMIYYLEAHQNLIGDFLKVLEIEETFSCRTHSFTFLNEQSFSDFGDSDLTIIIKEKDTEKKTVVFIEGKVKTFSGNYRLETEFKKIKNAKYPPFKGFSSNIFVQLYYKFLLQQVKNLKKEDTEDLKINDLFKKKNRNKEGNDKVVERKIGDNEVVKKARNMIEGEEVKYYYVAILPEIIKTEDLQSKFIELNKGLNMKMATENVRCAYWGDIEKFFENEKANNIVIQNFKFNRVEDENGGKKSQIY